MRRSRILNTLLIVCILPVLAMAAPAASKAATGNAAAVVTIPASSTKKTSTAKAENKETTAPIAGKAIPAQRPAPSKPAKSKSETAKSREEAAKTSVAKASTNTASSKPRGLPPLLLQGISWKGSAAKGTLTLTLQGAPLYQCTYTPANAAKSIPARLTVELPGVVPSNKIKFTHAPKNLPASRILITQSATATQIVIDCERTRAYSITAGNGTPNTLRIALSTQNDLSNGTQVSKPDKDRDSTKAAGSVMEQLGLTVNSIMLDAGHGGKDPGTMANGVTEREFTLKMMKFVGAALQQRGFTVHYTRTTDTYITLEERTVTANDHKVDLFISLHANANPNSAISGLETYYLDMAKSKGAALVAARENAVSSKKISDLQFILTDLMLNAKMEESHDLATCVHKGILSEVREANFAFKDNGVRSAPFYVLTGARMPAILVEFGYVSNKDDAAKLGSDKFLQEQAAGLADGIVAYKNKLARFASKKN